MIGINQSAKNLKELLIFILGGFGVSFFQWVQPLIANCNSLLFSLACMILTYGILNSILNSILRK